MFNIATSKDLNKINYYINESFHQKLTKRELYEIIKNIEYGRLDEYTKLNLSLSEMSIGEQKYTFSQKIMHKQNCS